MQNLFETKFHTSAHISSLAMQNILQLTRAFNEFFFIKLSQK